MTICKYMYIMYIVVVNILHSLPFPTFTLFLKPLQHTAFKNNVARAEIAHEGEISLFVTTFSSPFNNYTLIRRDFRKKFAQIFSNSAADLSLTLSLI